jgi:glycosyltransferase involved in cell wall biosynthesis
MTTSPFFSIVTVTLNSGDGLRATADSVAAQSCENYEHLIKDGGSIDGSVDALLPHPRRRIVRASDQSVYDGMNQALKSCSGQWVLFLNSGDVLLGPDVLARIAAMIQVDDSIDVAYCDRRELESGVEFVSPDRLSPFFLFRNTLCHQVCFVRARCFAKIGAFDTTLRIAADQDFLGRAILRERVKSEHIPILGVGYRGGGLSTWAANRRQLKEEARLVRSRHFTQTQRLMFRCILFVTLPNIRIALVSRFPRFRVYYVRMASAMDRASRVFRASPRVG